MTSLADLRKSQVYSPLHRVASCRRVLTYGHSSTCCSIRKSGRVDWSFLARCESKWCCLNCTPFEAMLDAERLSDTLDIIRRDGLAIFFVTLTARHYFDDGLADLMTRFQNSRRDFFASRGWRALARANDYIGNVRSWETTDSPQHGWHAHTHEFLAFPSAQVKHVLHDFYPKAWADACKAHGLYSSRSFGTRVDQVSATTYATAAKYTCAWGPEQELTLSPFKTAKGGNRTVWDLLKAATAGSDEARDRWQEYSHATFGRKRLSWSGSMRDYIADRREPEEQTNADIDWTRLPSSAWHVLRRHNGDVAVLRDIADGNLAHAQELVTRARLEDPLFDRYHVPTGGSDG
jgi:hypothetical protein